MPLNPSSLFNEEPNPWGLRGDPYLWEEMQRSLQSCQPISSVVELEKLLHQTFYELTSHKAEGSSDLYVKRFEHGGMSSGHISVEFWLETAFPLLLQRAELILGNTKS